ncbi:MAG: tetratricopeptide repeat protein [Spirochaetaceae bacterium]|jgi:tetratricopeptide (TPR) repeat protein|nr:tetratricopeptide repeat protein [Spirochaetaceae bacterium]
MDELFTESFGLTEDLADNNKTQTPEEALVAELSKKGYQCLKDERLEDAKDAFGEILTHEETNNYALVGMGDALRKMGHFKEAIDYYKKCLEFHEGNNYALFGMADCYKAMRQYKTALAIWERYLENDNQNITVLTRIADAFRKTKEFDKSKKVYQKVLAMEDNNPYALIGLGHLHYDFKEYREALRYWKKIFDLHGEDVDIRVLTSMGNCYRKLRQFEDGVFFFGKALEKDEDNFYALFGMADCYRGMNNNLKSLEYWLKILEQDPHNKVILTRAGDSYRHLGDFDKASEYYNKALNIEFDTYAVLGLAIIAKSQKKYDEAISSLRRLIQQDPRDYHYCIELADCLLKKGDKNGALEELVRFSRFGNRNAQIATLIEKLQGQ